LTTVFNRRELELLRELKSPAIVFGTLLDPNDPTAMTYGQATRKPIDSQEGTLGAGRRDAMLLSLVLAPMRKQR
jgi:hypothetical protein